MEFEGCSIRLLAITGKVVVGSIQLLTDYQKSSLSEVELLWIFICFILYI